MSLKEKETTSELHDRVKLTRLRSSAVVRLDGVPESAFDHNDLPMEEQGVSKKGKPKIAKALKGIASYLSSRIKLSFQECEVSITETVGGLLFEINTPNNSRTIYEAPLYTLVDVSSDFVGRQDKVTVSELPASFDPPSDTSGVVESSENGTPRKKGERITALFRAYDESGLTLVFKSPRSDTANLKKVAPFTKVEIQFPSPADRDSWQSFCREAYIGLLLDSIRNPNTIHADPNETIAPPSPLSTDEVSHYVDFFLFGRTSDTEERAPDSLQLSVVPCDGRLRVNGHVRKLTVERRKDEQGVMKPYLVLRPSSIKQRVKKASTIRIPLSDIQICAESEKSGTEFYIVVSSYPKERDEVEEEDDVGLHCRLPSQRQRNLLCDSGEASHRGMWFKWFKSLLGNEIVFLDAESADKSKTT